MLFCYHGDDRFMQTCVRLQLQTFNHEKLNDPSVLTAWRREVVIFKPYSVPAGDSDDDIVVTIADDSVTITTIMTVILFHFN